MLISSCEWEYLLYVINAREFMYNTISNSPTVHCTSGVHGKEVKIIKLWITGSQNSLLQMNRFFFFFFFFFFLRDWQNCQHSQLSLLSIMSLNTSGSEPRAIKEGTDSKLGLPHLIFNIMIRDFVLKAGFQNPLKRILTLKINNVGGLFIIDAASFISRGYIPILILCFLW